MHVELVRTVTRDGLRVDGALVEGRGSGGGKGPTAAVLLPGVAANFYTSSTFDPLIPRLQELGLAALMVNTRGHDSVFGATVGTVRRRLGAAYETVDDCRHDVLAWVDFLKSRGHDSLMLIGHSLGAVKAVYALARDHFPEFSAIVAVSCPRLSHTAFMNAPDSSSLFWESMHTAKDMVKAGQGEELFTSKYPFPLLITAAGYIDKYGPDERYNVLKFAGELRCPALFTYGSKELTSGGIAFAGMPEALSALPGGQRRTVEVIEGADHVYTGVTDRLVTEIERWITCQDWS
jgi:pimeloyl-ACP methyl ester carboxylesterase